MQIQISGIGSVTWVVLATSISLVCFLPSLSAQSGFDPRSMAMGGVGVAVANPSTAPFFNPAVLSLGERERFAIDVPTLGVRLSDPGKLIDALDSFQGQLLASNLESSVSTFNAAPSEASSADLVAAIDDLNSGLGSLAGRPIQGSLGVGATLGDTGQKFGWTLYGVQLLQGGAFFNYRDGGFLAGFADAIDQIDFDDPTNNSQALLDLLSDFVTYTPDGMGGVSDITVLPFLEGDQQSTIDAMAFDRKEYGAALSTMFGDYACGVTPKVVSTRLFDYSADSQGGDITQLDGPDFLTEYQDFNFDVGVAKQYGDGWTVGLVGRNLIKRNYPGFRRNPMSGVFEPTGNSITTSPTFHVGAAREEEWGIFAIDFDLQETKLFEGMAGSQFLSAGVEYDLFGWGQLRAGYRANLSNSDRSVTSAGIGFSPFGVHVDLAVAGNDNEVGIAAQVGFRF